MKRFKLGKSLLIAVPMLLLAIPLVLLSLARLEMTPNGVHTRLLLPAGADAKIGIHLYSGSGDTPHIPGFLDGPVIKPAAGSA